MSSSNIDTLKNSLEALKESVDIKNVTAQADVRGLARDVADLIQDLQHDERGKFTFKPK